MTATNILSEKYEQVRNNVNRCLTKISNIKISHSRGNQQIEDLVGRLTAIKTNFDEELDFLKNNSEWNKFTIAFFGETNAGKSTIIETLRILFDEQGRKLELEQQGADLANFEAAYPEKIKYLSLTLKGSFAVFADDTAIITDDINGLAKQYRGQPINRQGWLNQEYRETAGRIVATDIPALLRHKQDLQQRSSASGKIDGCIIGTGEADFTKGNVEYEFNCEGKKFLLIDVPGIEGDESKYENFVQKAIAKAHLVFYVNGTGKKPESTTADKIKRYLNHYSTVFAICNVRGKADAYEFDKTSLESAHKGMRETSEQTRKVLVDKIGADNFAGVGCVQGLLAFSAVSYDRLGKSTIDQTRENDLIKAQTSYRREFGSIEEMRRFSQISTIEHLITERFSTFKSDIFRSNQRKLQALVAESVVQLGRHLSSHEKLSCEIKLEFKECSQQILESIVQFDTSLKNKRNNAKNKFFSDVSDISCDLIQEFFDDKDVLAQKMDSAIEKRKRTFSDVLSQENESEMRDLSMNIERAWHRLEENVKKIRFKTALKTKDLHHMSLRDSINMSDFNINDFGKALLNIGSYTFTGFKLGNIVGAVVGALVGILSSILSFFGGKDKKIRKAQSQARDNIDNAREKFSITFDRETRSIIEEVRTQIQSEVLDPINVEESKLDDVGTVLSRQIAQISQILSSVKEMKYGTI